MAPTWLVACRGRPGRLGRAWIRPDALSRMSRAALEADSTVFLLFEDQTLICLKPSFGTWCRQEKLLQRLEALLAGENVSGAVSFGRQTLEKHMEGVLSHCDGFQRILRFTEGGDFVLGKSSATPTLKAPSQSCQTLCIIGGVRDMHISEIEALEKAASKVNLSIQTVSFGNKPELTSKCMKAVAAMDAADCFEAAVDSCKGKPCPEHNSESHRALLHIIYRLETGVTLEDFISHPVRQALAFPMLVDTFMSSHCKIAYSRLTFISDKDEVLSLEAPYTEFLQEEKALRFLKEQYVKYKQQATLDKVLRLHVKGMPHSRRQMRVRVLHADRTALPLAYLQVTKNDLIDKNMATVAVVIASAADAAWVRAAAAAASACAYERASLGSCIGVAAYASILNHEGLLAAVISKPLAGLPCPTRKVIHASLARPPCTMRKVISSPKKGAAPPGLIPQSPSSTRAASVCSSTCSETTEPVDLDVQGSLGTIEELLEVSFTPTTRSSEKAVSVKKRWVELEEEWEQEQEQDEEARTLSLRVSGEQEARPCSVPMLGSGATSVCSSTCSETAEPADLDVQGCMLPKKPLDNSMKVQKSWVELEEEWELEEKAGFLSL